MDEKHIEIKPLKQFAIVKPDGHQVKGSTKMESREAINSVLPDGKIGGKFSMEKRYELWKKLREKGYCCIRVISRVDENWLENLSK